MENQKIKLDKRPEFVANPDFNRIPCKYGHRAFFKPIFLFIAKDKSDLSIGFGLIILLAFLLFKMRKEKEPIRFLRQKIKKLKIEKLRTGKKRLKNQAGLKRFYGILDILNKAIPKDISKAKRLYIEAKGHYADLEDHGRRKVYHELAHLYNRFAESIKKAERTEEPKIKLEKKKLKYFFHKIGLYKIPEEKTQIALQKEKERKVKIWGAKNIKSI